MLSCMTFFGKLVDMVYMMDNSPGSREKLMTTDYKGINWREKN